MEKDALKHKILEFEISIFNLNYNDIIRLQTEIINILINKSLRISNEELPQYLSIIKDLSMAFENRDYLLFRDLLTYRVTVLFKNEES